MITFTNLTGIECPTEVAKLINAIIAGKTNIDLDNLSQTGQAILDGKASINLNNLSVSGQAILDAKIEAEALAAQNGYIKFKLNGISILICFGHWITGTSPITVTLPMSYTDLKYTAVISPTGGALLNTSFRVGAAQTVSSFIINHSVTNSAGTTFDYITIGY